MLYTEELPAGVITKRKVKSVDGAVGVTKLIIKFLFLLNISLSFKRGSILIRR